MKKVIKYALVSILTLIVLIYFIGSRENMDNSTDNNKQNTSSELETEEKDMTKERKRFTTFDEDCAKAIHNKTEWALYNIIRIYDYQKDIPSTKKLAENMKEYTGDDEQSKKILLVELGSCSEFSKRLYFNFLEAKEMYKESGRRGTYLEYLIENKMLEPMIDDQYKQMEDLFFEKDDKVVDITKDIFKKLDKLTDGETVEENEKNYKKKYIVLKEVLDSMGSPYYDEIVAAEEDIKKNYKENK